MSKRITLPDQYNVEPLSSYSGSYSDQIMYGCMTSKRIVRNSLVSNVTTVVLDFSRAEIGLVTNTQQENKNTIVRENKTMWLSDYYQMVYGRYIPSKTANYATQFIDESEHYIDSYTPNPFLIHIRNGGLFASNTNPEDPALTFSSLLITQHYSGSRKSIINGGNVEDFVNYKELSASLAICMTNLGTNQGAGPIADSPYESVDDHLWRFVYPYSYKYKDIQRNFSTKTTRTLSKNYTATLNTDAQTATVPLTSNEVGTVMLYTSGTRLDNASYVSSPYEHNDAEMVVLVDMVISASEGDYFQHNNVIATPYTKFAQRKAYCKPETLQDVYYCLGKNGTYQSPWITSGKGFISRGYPEFLLHTYFMAVAPVIRGYKYGIYKANPTQSKAYWRRNRYGQFRDRLEQRQYSKMYYDYSSETKRNPEYSTGYNFNSQAGTANIVGEAVVRVNFVKDTNSYFTASNYSNFNPTTTSVAYLSNSRDSGIYDFEYKSAQPFEDRDI